MAKKATAAASKNASPAKAPRGRGRPAGQPKRTRKVAAAGPSFKSYIFRVLKQVAPKTAISRNSMSILNGFANDLFEKVATEAGSIARYSKKTTMTAREVQAAVRLILPGELCKHAITEGTKAVTNLEG